MGNVIDVSAVRDLVYVTAHSEYYVRGGVCVAVRDRGAGVWLAGHPAIGQRLEGGLHVDPRGGMEPHAAPRVGDRLVLSSPGAPRTVLTSPMLTAR